jgi:hypothetical protein
MYDLLGHVHGKENLLSKPVEPTMTDYAQRARTTARSRQTQDQGTFEGQTLSPEPDQREVLFTDLTADS